MKSTTGFDAEKPLLVPRRRFLASSLIPTISPRSTLGRLATEFSRAVNALLALHPEYDGDQGSEVAAAWETAHKAMRQAETSLKTEMTTSGLAVMFVAPRLFINTWATEGQEMAENDGWPVDVLLVDLARKGVRS